MNDEAEVLAASAAWDTALLSNDADAVATFVTNDWVYVGPDGAASRDDIVNWIATGRLVHHTMRTIGRPRTAAYGDVVIVTAHKRSSGSWDGQAYAADEWISEVFVRQDAGWRCVLSQKSPVGPR
jgi:ketosteroid isomerase-like protein